MNRSTPSRPARSFMTGKKEAGGQRRETGGAAHCPSPARAERPEHKQGGGKTETSLTPHRTQHRARAAVDPNDPSDKALHDAVLLRHPALEADHLDEDFLVAPLEAPHAAEHLVALLGEHAHLRAQCVDLRLGVCELCLCLRQLLREGVVGG